MHCQVGVRPKINVISARYAPTAAVQLDVNECAQNSFFVLQNKKYSGCSMKNGCEISINLLYAPIIPP
jgi:hypothetical protein